MTFTPQSNAHIKVAGGLAFVYGSDSSADLHLQKAITSQPDAALCPLAVYMPLAREPVAAHPQPNLIILHN